MTMRFADKFDPEKPIKTRGGLNATILEQDVETPRGKRLIGLITLANGHRIVGTWLTNGLHEDEKRDWDILNPIVLRTVYINLMAAKGKPHVLANLSLTGPFDTHQKAEDDALRSLAREALVVAFPIPWDDVE